MSFVSRFCIGLVGLVLLMSSAHAATITAVDLTPYVNSDLTTWTGGGNYPQNGGIVSVGGIDFQVATVANGKTGVINSQGVASSTTIATNVSNANAAYIIINSAWGSLGTATGSLTFYGANPANIYTYTLTEGSNIRDHFNGLYVNSINASNLIGTASYGDGADRFDAYKVLLPSGFANDALKSVVFNDFGVGENGSPFLAALSISSVPLPSSFPLFVFSLVGLGLFAMRARQSIV